MLSERLVPIYRRFWNSVTLTCQARKGVLPHDYDFQSPLDPFVSIDSQY